jgi:hypothetical protein
VKVGEGADMITARCDAIVRAHIEGSYADGRPFFSPDDRCRIYCLNGTLCSYHEGMWDGAEAAFQQIQPTTNNQKQEKP